MATPYVAPIVVADARATATARRFMPTPSPAGGGRRLVALGLSNEDVSGIHLALLE